jgi:hypothetical protein
VLEEKWFLKNGFKAGLRSKEDNCTLLAYLQRERGEKQPPLRSAVGPQSHAPVKTGKGRCFLSGPESDDSRPTNHEAFKMATQPCHSV